MATSGQKIPDSTIRQIVRMVRAGCSQRNIAVAAQVSQATVWRVLKDLRERGII